ELDATAFEPGDDVFLGNELNVVVGRSPGPLFCGGETAYFERYTADRRLVLRHRDEEIVVDAAGPLAQVELQAGDQVRWDRATWPAFEKVERPSAGRRFLLNDVPDIGPEQVGGQQANLETLLAALTMTLVAPDKARAYGLGGRQSILMVGPPG